MNNFLTQREVAELLNVSERTIQWWRQRGYFPQPGYVGRRPVYRREVVDEWLAQQASQ